MTYAEEYYVYSTNSILCPPCVLDMIDAENAMLRTKIREQDWRMLKLECVIKRLTVLATNTKDSQEDKLARLEAILKFCK